MSQKRYFKSRNEALNVCKGRNGLYGINEVHRMPKGTRHHGQYYVGSYMEWLNFAN